MLSPFLLQALTLAPSSKNTLHVPTWKVGGRKSHCYKFQIEHIRFFFFKQKWRLANASQREQEAVASWSDLKAHPVWKLPMCSQKEETINDMGCLWSADLNGVRSWAWLNYCPAPLHLDALDCWRSEALIHQTNVHQNRGLISMRWNRHRSVWTWV